MTRSDGRLRFDDVADVISSRLDLVPRFRQRVERVPFDLGLPVWIDDSAFDLDFHLRRAALPAPGGRRELADFVQRVLSRPLDRTKPLWELYVVEGLEDGHVAVLLKVHHAMVDGLSGMHVAAAIYDLTTEPPAAAAARPWVPEPEPSPRDLVRGAIDDLTTNPIEAVSALASNARRSPELAALGLGSIVSGVRSLFGRWGARPGSSLDVRVGPNRRFAMPRRPSSGSSRSRTRSAAP